MLLVRAVRWARLPGHGHRVAEACKKFGLTASQYRKAARELGDEAAIRTDEELMLAGLHPTGAAIHDLIYYWDWINPPASRPTRCAPSSTG